MFHSRRRRRRPSTSTRTPRGLRFDGVLADINQNVRKLNAAASSRHRVAPPRHCSGPSKAVRFGGEGYADNGDDEGEDEWGVRVGGKTFMVDNEWVTGGFMGDAMRNAIRKGRAGGRLAADGVLHNALEMMDKFPAMLPEPSERSELQKRFHVAFLTACLPKIYGQQFAAVRRRVIAEFGLDDDPRAQTLVVAPRRFGKTWSVAIFVAALLWCCPGIEISVFSTGQRASTLLMEKVIMFLCTQGAEYDARLLKKNQEHLYLYASSNDLNSGSISKLHCYPQSEKTTRGVDADIVIMEEAASMDESFFTQVVAPLLSVGGTGLVGISTPKGPHNFYSRMLGRRTEDGRNIFRVVHVDLICDRCRAADRGEKCTHMEHMRPKWLDVGRAAMVRAILADHEDIYKAEALGAIVGDKDHVFEAEVVEKFRSASAHIDDANRLPWLFIIVDPASGGSSRYAISAGYIANTRPNPSYVVSAPPSSPSPSPSSTTARC
jgi:hypothetical protein